MSRKAYPPVYCYKCEEKLASEKWFPFCDHVCTVDGINQGWFKTASGYWSKKK